MIIDPYRYGGAYSYWNPADKAANAVLSDSNKVVGGPLGGPKWVRSIKSHNTGKRRIQFVDVAHPASAGALGIGFATAGSIGTFLGNTAAGYAMWGNYGANVQVYNNNAFSAFTGSMATNDVFDLLLDFTAGHAWWAEAGVPISGNPVAGTGPMATFTPGATLFLAADAYVANASIRLRTNPAEFTGSGFAGFTDGWPD